MIQDISETEQELKDYVDSKAQHTLAKSVFFSGVGVHSGLQSKIIVNPSEANTGIRFIKDSVPVVESSLNAIWDNVTDTKLCTVISNQYGHKIHTIEHLMAALSALGIDNACICMCGNDEIPILDGSSKEFFDRFKSAGLEKQYACKKEIVILETIEIRHENKIVGFSPCDRYEFDVEVDFSSKGISKQRFLFELTADNFENELASARTFGFHEDVSSLKKLGLLNGGSLNNAILVKEGKIVNQEGLRYADEFVRHKTLDAVGDMFLAGCRIRGKYFGKCSGHYLNNQLLRLLFSSPSAYMYL